MRKSIFIIGAAIVYSLAACDSKPAEEKVEEQMEETTEAGEEMDAGKIHYGEVIDESGAKYIDEFAAMMQGKDSLEVKVQAVAAEVCQNKGCWMKVENADGSMMRVKFKDYGFFVPKDIAGKNIVFEGTAYRDTTSVEDLRHYAEDGGQSKEEIAAITKPEISTTFIATGVLIPHQ